MRSAAVACACVLVVARFGLAVGPGVGAGGLQARVVADPWHLTFEDGAGAVVLIELAGGATGAAGPLGLRDGGQWIHATRLAWSHTRRGR